MSRAAVPHATDRATPTQETLPRPGWRLVLALALPVLLQQALVLVVNQSDRFLAGHLRVLTDAEQGEMASLHLLAGAALASPAPGGAPLATLASAGTKIHRAEQIASRQAAFLAAQTTAHYLAWFIVSYAVIVSVGSTALVARFIGAGDHALAIAVTHQSLLLAVMFGVAGSAFGLLGGIDLMVETLQLQGEAAVLARAYLEPLFALLTCQLVETAGIACLVGAGDTRTGLWVTAGVAVVNLPLAWTCCLGFGPLPPLGFVGIAVGTAISHALGAVAVLAVLARGRYGLRLSAREFRPRPDLMRRLLRVGIPAGLDSLSVVAGQFWFLRIVNTLGNDASAAHGIAIGWEALGYQSGAAFGTAAMTLVGQNLGAGRPDEARRAGWRAFALGLTVMSLMGALFFTLAEPMFRLFTNHEPVIATGVPVLRLVAFAMPSLAGVIVFLSALRGAGDTRVPVLFTWVGFFLVRIPLAYLCAYPSLDLGPLGVWPGLGRGLYGTWLAMFADLIVRGLFFTTRFARGRWQQQRV